MATHCCDCKCGSRPFHVNRAMRRSVAEKTNPEHARILSCCVSTKNISKAFRINIMCDKGCSCTSFLVSTWPPAEGQLMQRPSHGTPLSSSLDCQDGTQENGSHLSAVIIQNKARIATTQNKTPDPHFVTLVRSV